MESAAKKRHNKYVKKIVRLGLAENVGPLSDKKFNKNKKRSKRKNAKAARKAKH